MKKTFSEFSNPISAWIFALCSLPFVLSFRSDIWSETNLVFGLYFGVAILEGLLLGYLWSLFTLKLQIDESGVTFRYFSWRFRSVHYNWRQIRSAQIVAFEPKEDFQGWGIRKSAVYGKGYITRGKNGLFLELMNGEKMMMSVLDTEMATEALHAYTPGSYSL